MAKDVLKIAAGELGITEFPANSNRTKYGAWYGLDGQPWCMMFVQWCFHQAGLALQHRSASCSDMLSWYRKYAPEKVTSTPQPRDIIIYNFGHTGIVESVASGTITAIEGNTSAGDSGSQSNGGGVFRRVRSKSLVTAYIRPFDNLDKEDNMTGKEIYDELNKYLKTQTLPDWAKAEMDEAVKMGITDGSDPMGLIPRYQAAIMSKRAAGEK